MPKTWYILSFQILIDMAKIKGNILTVTQCYRKQWSRDPSKAIKSKLNETEKKTHSDSVSLSFESVHEKCM